MLRCPLVLLVYWPGERAAHDRKLLVAKYKLLDGGGAGLDLDGGVAGAGP